MSNVKTVRQQLVKETVNFAKFMGDMEAFFQNKWKNGAGPSLDVKEYVGQRQVDTLVEAFQKISTTLEVIHADLNAIEAKQSKQDINIVKAGQAKLRTTSPVVDDMVKEAHKTGDVLEWLNDVKLMDPDLYTRGGRIYYLTIGLSPRDIQYNEFDLEFLNDPDFDLADLDYIRENWSTFAQKAKDYTGSTLLEFVKAYAMRRGISFTPKKRGRKSN